MRITENVRALRALQNTQEAASRFDRAARVASSGKRVSDPSDDPVAYATALRHSSRIDQLEARAMNLEQASSDLAIAEGALASAGQAVVRAREIATEMANGSMSAQDRASAASEIRSLRETLIGAANVRGAHGYLFGGTMIDVAPFDATGAFRGVGSLAQLEIGDGVYADAGVNGADAFTMTGVSGRDAFGELDALATALEANDLKTIQNSLEALDGVHAQILRVRTDAGAKIERFAAAAGFANDAKLVVTKARAAQVEADAVTAYSELNVAKSAYERSLEVTQKILALSSIDRG